MNKPFYHSSIYNPLWYSLIGRRFLKNEIPGPKGLQNDGWNCCYMNSIIQLLSASYVTVEWLSYLHRETSACGNKMNPLLRSIETLTSKLYHNHSLVKHKHKQTVEAVLEHLRLSYENNEFIFRKQQDAQEILQYFLDEFREIGDSISHSCYYYYYNDFTSEGTSNHINTSSEATSWFDALASVSFNEAKAPLSNIHEEKVLNTVNSRTHDTIFSRSANNNTKTSTRSTIATSATTSSTPSSSCCPTQYQYSTPNTMQKKKNLMDGTLLSSVCCTVCGFESNSIQSFNMISVQLPSSTRSSAMDGFKKISLEQCLASYTAWEEVMYKCRGCASIAIEASNKIAAIPTVIPDVRDTNLIEPVLVDKRSKKRLSIAHCPGVLFLHINRKGYDHWGNLSKDNSSIQFEETLDIRPYVSTHFGGSASTSSSSSDINGSTSTAANNSCVLSADVTASNDSAWTGITLFSDCVEKKVKHSQKDETVSSSRSTDDDDRGGDGGSNIVKSTASYNGRRIVGDGGAQYLYRLTSIVEHTGGVSGGHYIAYKKQQVVDKHHQYQHTSKWYCISDEHVYPSMSFTQLRSICKPYILLYEKVNNTKEV